MYSCMVCGDCLVPIVTSPGCACNKYKIEHVIYENSWDKCFVINNKSYFGNLVFFSVFMCTTGNLIKISCSIYATVHSGSVYWTADFNQIEVFSSPELKAQVSFSDHLSSVVCLSVHPSVCLSVRLSVNFSHFHLLLQNHWANFNQTWHKVS